MKMKKFAAVLVAGLTVMSLAGCGKKAPEPVSSAAEVVSTVSEAASTVSEAASTVSSAASAVSEAAVVSAAEVAIAEVESTPAVVVEAVESAVEEAAAVESTPAAVVEAVESVVEEAAATVESTVEEAVTAVESAVEEAAAPAAELYTEVLDFSAKAESTVEEAAAAVESAAEEAAAPAAELYTEVLDFSAKAESTVEEAAAVVESTVEDVAAAVAAVAAVVESTPAEAVELAPITTVEEGKLNVCTNAAFPPYEMTDDNGGYTGIDMEIAGKIAEYLGLELVINDIDFSATIIGVSSGKYDCVMAGMTVNEERKQNINFSNTYANAVQVVIVKDGSEITSIDSLADEKLLIGCQEGTTGYIYAADDYGEDRVKTYPNGALAIKALTNGQVDAVIIDNEPAKAFVKANEGLQILDTEYVAEEYAIGVGKDNEPLLAGINAALESLTADGTIQAIIDKYITAE